MTRFRQTTLTTAAAGLCVLGALAAAPAPCQAAEDSSIRPFTYHAPQAKR